MAYANKEVRAEYVRQYRQRNPEKFNAEKKENYRKGRTDDENTGRRWTSAEEIRITEPNRPNDRELAKQLRRSVQAIQVRRTRIKEI